MARKLNYAKSITNTNQRTKARKDQVKNSEGGYVFQVDKWSQLRRFLILGSEGGTYYIRQGDLTLQNAQNLEACVESDIERTLKEIVEVSDKGLAVRNDPAIFALALCVVNRPNDGKCAYQISADTVKGVIRTGTHLLTFINYLDELCSWGTGAMKTVRHWYEGKTADQLAYQMVKYQNRNQWTQRDALRVIHPKPADPKTDLLFKWVTDREKFMDGDIPKETGIPVVDAYMRAHKKGTQTKTIIKLIEDYNLTHEMLPTEQKAKPEVWEALSQRMPMTAMIRNLGVMSANGLLTRDNLDLIGKIEDKLTNVDMLKKARVHPMAVLFAMRTYAQGHGFRGRKSWDAVPRICDALNDAFYLSFQAVEPTGKRIMIACDVSGSMTQPIMNSNVSCCEAAGALAMVTARTEKNYAVYGFSHTFKAIDITPKLRLDTVADRMQDYNFGGTDCALPMLHALKKKAKYDAFLVITDNETWAGRTHPFQALKNYRKEVNKDARLIVMGMASNGFSIADPKDAGMLDVVGMDASVPNVMSNFIRGEL